MASNFDFLVKYWPDMAQIGVLAELYLYADPNACIYKIGVLAERVAQEIASLRRSSCRSRLPMLTGSVR